MQARNGAMAWRTRAGVFTLLLMVASSAAGCAAADASSTHEPPTAVSPAPKTGDGQLRTDLEPVAQRYPSLREAESVVWMSGTTGTSNVGPSTYWMDVVAVVPQAEMDTLLALDDLTEVTAPVLVDGMVKIMPSGPFLGSPELTRLFSADGYYVESVALDARTRTVVLSGMFE